MFDRFALGAAAAALLACAGPAAAHDAPQSLSLSCRGTLAAPRDIAPARLSRDLDAQRGASAALREPAARLVRTPARMTVLVQNGAVKVRPPVRRDGMSGKWSADGWYPLSDVVVSADRIAGVAPYGDALSRRLTLVVDRGSGDVRFGGFEGECEAARTG